MAPSTFPKISILSHQLLAEEVESAYFALQPLLKISQKKYSNQEELLKHSAKTKFDFIVVPISHYDQVVRDFIRDGILAGKNLKIVLVGSLLQFQKGEIVLTEAINLIPEEAIGLNLSYLLRLHLLSNQSLAKNNIGDNRLKLLLEEPLRNIVCESLSSRMMLESWLFLLMRSLQARVGYMSIDKEQMLLQLHSSSLEEEQCLQDVIGNPAFQKQLERSSNNTFVLSRFTSCSTYDQERAEEIELIVPLPKKMGLEGEVGVLFPNRGVDLKNEIEAELNLLASIYECYVEIRDREQMGKQLLMDSMAEGVVMLGLPRSHFFLNTQARRMLGFDTGDEISYGLLSERLRKFALEESIQECVESGERVCRDVSLIGLQKPKVYECEISPVKLEQNLIAGQLLVLRDVTKRRELENMQNDFVSTVSHELRTPMAIVREGISQIMDGFHGEVSENQTKFLKVTLEAVDRLGRMIDGLLDLSKMEAGRLALRREQLDLNEVVREVVETFAFQIEEKKVIVKAMLPEQPMMAYVDRDHMVQVFTNLLGNSLKFTPPGGKIEIRVHDEGQQVICEVEDTGQGIEEQDLPNVFKKFQQFDRLYGPGEKGTGLGLAICKKIVEMHRGQIGVESHYGKGSRFFFSIPRVSDRELFQDQLVREVKLAASLNVSVTVCAFQVLHHLAMDDEKQKTEVNMILSRVHGVIQKCLRRKADFAMDVGNYVCIILPQTPKEDGPFVVERVLEKIGVEFSGESFFDDIKIESKVLAYPEDAGTGQELANLL